MLPRPKKPFLTMLAGLLTASSLMLLSSAGATGERKTSPPCVEPVEICYPTILRAGEGGNDLQVHIVGRELNVIEAYFRQEFYREELSITNLHCGRVLLAPKNDLGTFVVLLGEGGDSFKAFAWKKGQFEPTTTGVITPEKGIPLHLSWVTPHILKATYGTDKSLIIRFNDSDEGWKALYPRPSK